MVDVCFKSYCCSDEPTRITKLSCKGPNKNSLNDEPINKYRTMLEEKESFFQLFDAFLKFFVR